MDLRNLVFFLFGFFFSLRSVGQITLVHFPDSLSTSSKYYSPTYYPVAKPAFWGILTIGQPLDSLDFEPYYKVQPKYQIADTIKFNFNNQGLAIIFDTMQEVDCIEYVYQSKENGNYYPSNKVSYYEHGQLKIIEATMLDQISFKGLPVYIINLSDSQITIRQPKYRVQLIQEALDKNNEWKPIESLFNPASGVSPLAVRTLKPGQLIVTAVFKYKGDYSTQLRLKFISSEKTYYSKPYTGSINYSQISKAEAY